MKSCPPPERTLIRSIPGSAPTQRILTVTGEKLENLEKSVAGSNKETAALHREIAVMAGKLEQLEKETNLLANMQQLSGEF